MQSKNVILNNQDQGLWRSAEAFCILAAHPYEWDDIQDYLSTKFDAELMPFEHREHDFDSMFQARLADLIELVYGIEKNLTEDDGFFLMLDGVVKKSAEAARC